MKGDFTRSTYKPVKNYSSVHMQQGRVQLDADWNEQNDIATHLDQTTRLDVIGSCGVPEVGGGFHIDATPDVSDLTLSAGRIYADGILCENASTAIPISAFLANNRVQVPIWKVDEREFQDNEWVELSADGVKPVLTQITAVDIAQRALTFKDNVSQFNVPSGRLRRVVTLETQPDLPGAPAVTPVANQTDLIYLDVWQRHITVVEDPEIREVALGGPDTTTRVKTVWQVRVLPNVGKIDCKADVQFPAPSCGRLTTDVASTPTPKDPCIVPPSGGFRGLENHYYRVEIHHGGEAYVWPRPTVKTTSVEDVPANNQVKVKDWTVDGRAWEVGQVVEVLSKESDAKNQAGTLAHITAVDGNNRTLTLDTDVSSFKTNTSRAVRRVATFKWSRDNGSRLFAIQEFNAVDKTKVKLTRLGRDQVLGLHVGDWVEVLGDVTELNGQPGTLAQIMPNGIDEEAQMLTLSADVSAYSAESHPKVRPWDQKSDALPVTPGPFLLEEGIQVSFSGSNFQTGDYWSFAARTATADIERLTEAPPQGIERHYCKLALVTWQQVANQWQVKPQDCRLDFPSLTTICADDVCFDNTKCQLPQVETVQDALDRLCQERDLRFHNKHLHGWGIVCGLEVTCGPADADGKRAQVTIGKGYAIDCEGNDLLLDHDDTIRVLDRALESKLIEPDKDGDVCLTLGLDQERKLNYGLEKFEPSKNIWQALLSGTLLLDFYNDCIKAIQDFLQTELTPPPEEKDLPAGPVTQRVAALTNLVAQPINPQAGQNIFISPREDKLMREFYEKLRKILHSETFCAMFDNARPFPDYPFKDLGMDTIFGKGQHTRLRLRPDGLEAYTVGPGLNPLQPSTTINRYDLKKKVLVSVIDPLVGAEVDKSKGNSGAGSVQDVAFSADSKLIYVIVPTRDNKNTIFRVGEITAKGINWRPPVTICDVKLVTLATTPADKTNVYAIGLGKGLYKINPNAVDPNMTPLASFNGVGHLEISADGRAFVTSADKSKAPIYDTVYAFRLPAVTKLDNFPLNLIEQGQDDIAIFTAADGAKTETLYNVVGTGNYSRSVMAFDLNTGQNLIGKPITVDSTTIHLEPYAPNGMLLMTCEDSYCVRMIDMNNNALVQSYLLPMQVGPIAIDSDRQAQRVYVLNYVSNTITVAPGKLFDPGFKFDLKALADYRKGVLEAFADLMGGFLQYLKDCLCDHFLVKCPECEPDDKIYLACVTIRNNQVHRVCNFSKRRYVKSFPTVGYWLSLVPIMPLLDRVIEEFCCIILPDIFSKFSVAAFETAAAEEAAPRVRTGLFRDGINAIQTADIMDALRRFMSKNRIATSLLSESLFEPRPAEAVAVEMTNIVGQPVHVAEEQLKKSNIMVRRVPYTPTTAASLASNLTGFYRTPEPGNVVTLFEKDGAVVYYSVAPGDPAKELRAQVVSLSQSLQVREAEMQQLRTAVDTQRPMVAQVDTLKAKLADTEEQLAGQRAALAQMDTLKAMVGEMQMQLDHQRTALTNVEMVRTTLSEIQHLLSQKDTDIASLSNQMTILKKQEALETDAMATQVNQLKAQFEEIKPLLKTQRKSKPATRKPKRAR